jgi:hypothetical protein
MSDGNDEDPARIVARGLQMQKDRERAIGFAGGVGCLVGLMLLIGIGIAGADLGLSNVLPDWVLVLGAAVVLLAPAFYFMYLVNRPQPLTKKERTGLAQSAVFLAIVVAVIVLGHNLLPSAASAPRANTPKIVLGGEIPSIQALGVPVSATIRVDNLGIDNQDVLLDLSGCSDAWVVDQVQSSHGDLQASGVDQYYDFGNLPPNGAARFRVLLNPDQAGNHACDVTVWGGLDANGLPAGTVLDTQSVSVAINP